MAAWVLAPVLGWLSAISAFVVLLFLGIMATRMICQNLFPYLDVESDADFANPEDFAPEPDAANTADLAPSDLDAPAPQADMSDDGVDAIGQNVDFDDFPQSDVSEEQIDASDDIFEDLESLDLDTPDVEETDLAIDDENLFDEEAFEARVREAMGPEEELDQSAEPEAQAPQDLTPEDPAETDEPFTPPVNEKPKSLLNDPGHRLAQNLVLVGASPSQARSSTLGPSPSLRPATLTAARSNEPDDLQKIRGVGDAIEGLLHQLGYFHFDQIAAWTPQEVAWVDENLEGFSGRVSRDQWVSQAIILAQGHPVEELDAESLGSLRLLGDQD